MTFIAKNNINITLLSTKEEILFIYDIIVPTTSNHDTHKENDRSSEKLWTKGWQ